MSRHFSLTVRYATQTPGVTAASAAVSTPVVSGDLYPVLSGLSFCRCFGLACRMA